VNVKKDPGKVVSEDIRFAFKGGEDTLINKGTNGRWKNFLSEKELAQYREATSKSMTTECAEWLENGWSGGGA